MSSVVSKSEFVKNTRKRYVEALIAQGMIDVSIVKIDESIKDLHRDISNYKNQLEQERDSRIQADKKNKEKDRELRILKDRENSNNSNNAISNFSNLATGLFGALFTGGATLGVTGALAIVEKNRYEAEMAEIKKIRDELHKQKVDVSKLDEAIEELSNKVVEFVNRIESLAKEKDIELAARVFGDEDGDAGIIRIAVFGMALETCEVMDVYARKQGLVSIDDIIIEFSQTPLKQAIDNLINGYPSSDDLERLFAYGLHHNPTNNAQFALKEFVVDFLGVNRMQYEGWAEKISSMSMIIKEPHNLGGLLSNQNQRNQADNFLVATESNAVNTSDIRFIYDKSDGKLGLIARLQRAYSLLNRDVAEIEDSIEDVVIRTNQLAAQLAGDIRDKKSHQESLRAGIRKNESLEDAKWNRIDDLRESHDRHIKRDVVSLGIRMGLNLVGDPKQAPRAVFQSMLNFAQNNRIELATIVNDLTGIGDLETQIANIASRYDRQKIDDKKLRAEIKALQQSISILQKTLSAYNSQIFSAQRTLVAESYFKREVIFQAIGFATQLDNYAKEAGLSSVDELLNIHINTPIGKALQHIAHGYPDSNDIYLLLSSVNLYTQIAQRTNTGLTPAESSVVNFVENAIKRSPSTYFSVASRIDDLKIIPKANEVDDPNDVLSAHYSAYTDIKKLLAIFFGDLDSLHFQSEEQSRKYLYYVHRHGTTTRMTDSDLPITDKSGKTQKKLVQLPPFDEVDDFGEEVIIRVNRRQSDMPSLTTAFTRICVADYILASRPFIQDRIDNLENVPEYPAASLMVEKTCSKFVEAMRLDGIDVDNQGVIGNIIVQSFFDFFANTGKKHGLAYIEDRNKLAACMRTALFIVELTGFEKKISNDALNNYDEFRRVLYNNTQNIVNTLPLTQIASAKAELEAFLGILTGEAQGSNQFQKLVGNIFEEKTGSFRSNWIR